MKTGRFFILLAVAALGMGLVAVAGVRLADDSPPATQEAAVQRGHDSDIHGSRTRRLTESITASDCAFLQNPESYLGAEGRRQRDIGRIAEDFVAQSALREQGMSSEEVPYKNFIDRHIFEKMRADRVPHAGLVNDETFLRRVMLDMAGRTPSPDEIREFLADPDAAKRDRMVEDLAASPEFVDKWTMFYGDLFRNVRNNLGNGVQRFEQARNAFYNWIRGAIADGWPYSDMARAMITANGSSFADGPATWMANGVTPMGPAQDNYDTLAVETSRQFLGMAHVDCLLCHDGRGRLNQLSAWGTNATRFQGWEMAAYFSRTSITRQAGAGNQPYVIAEAAAGAYNLNTNSGNRSNRERTNGVTAVMPNYLMNDQGATTAFRDSLSRTLVADRQFARAAVNYIWAEMMGLGIVDPPDAFDPARLDPSRPPPTPWSIQPSHPELLEELTTEFINSGLQIRHVIKSIAKSSAYQLSSRFPGQWQPDYTPYFARHYARRMKAEELHDALLRATSTTTSITVTGMAQPVMWAMQLPDPLEGGGSAAFLNTFLRGNRDNTPRSGEVNIQQALAMMNNNFVITRVRQTGAASLANRLIGMGRSDAQIVEDFYLRTLSRFPTPRELSVSLASFQGKTRQVAAEDLLWALTNRVDFLFNY